jgi:hypothetical protein
MGYSAYPTDYDKIKLIPVPKTHTMKAIEDVGVKSDFSTK